MGGVTMSLSCCRLGDFMFSSTDFVVGRETMSCAGMPPASHERYFWHISAEMDERSESQRNPHRDHSVPSDMLAYYCWTRIGPEALQLCLGSKFTQVGVKGSRI